MENQQLEVLLETLKKDLEFYKMSMKETARDMIDGSYTQYPVFAAHQHALSLGEILFDRADYGRHWSINATTLEELVSKNLITPDRLQRFKQTYKNPEKEMCILMITEQVANFVFVAY